jgi:hypothetical protein
MKMPGIAIGEETHVLVKKFCHYVGFKQVA